MTGFTLSMMTSDLVFHSLQSFGLVSELQVVQLADTRGSAVPMINLTLEVAVSNYVFYLQQCFSLIPEKFMVQQVGIAGCAVPMAGPVLEGIARGQCLMKCMEEPGCTGINYSPLDAHSGYCILVAPGPQSTQHAVLPNHGPWQYVSIIN